jgi:hypothetical protein
VEENKIQVENSENPSQQNQIPQVSSSTGAQNSSQTQRRVTVRRRNYSTGDAKKAMQDALDYIKANKTASIRSVSAQFGVDRKAFSLRLAGKMDISAHAGNQQIFSEEQESKIVKHCMEMADLGFGYDAIQVKNILTYFMTQEQRNRASIASNGWYYRFCMRHPEISRRRVEAFDKYRLRAINKESVAQYFRLLKLAMDKVEELSIKLTPNRVFSADEVGFDLNQKSGYIMAKKGSKNAFILTTGVATHLSIMSCVSAAGQALSPYFVLPGIRKRANFLNAGFATAGVSMTKNGWMTGTAFEEWTKFFIEEIKPLRGDQKDWCLLIVDGHSSHVLCPGALTVLSDHRILLLSLPSHSTSFLQPLDVSVFHSLKSSFRQSMQLFIKKNGLKIGLDDFTNIFEPSWYISHNPHNIRSGFEKTGIWPFNGNWSEENPDVFKINPILNSKEAKFNELREKALTDSSTKKLADAIPYIDFQVYNDHTESAEKETGMMLDRIFSRMQSNISQNNRQKNRKNCIGEDPSTAKLLNTTERIEKLEQTKNKKEEEKNEDEGDQKKGKEKARKKRKHSQVTKTPNKSSSK